jgi:hypothetical protein
MIANNYVLSHVPFRGWLIVSLIGFRSHPKDRPIQSPLTTHKGVWILPIFTGPYSVASYMYNKQGDAQDLSLPSRVLACYFYAWFGFSLTSHMFVLLKCSHVSLGNVIFYNSLIWEFLYVFQIRCKLTQMIQWPRVRKPIVLQAFLLNFTMISFNVLFTISFFFLVAAKSFQDASMLVP